MATTEISENSVNYTIPDNYKELEPILKENPDRFVVFPIKYHEIWSHYKKSSS